MRTKTTFFSVLALFVYFMSSAQNNYTWKEVSGQSIIIIPNSLDIEDEMNTSLKKELVIKSTLEAIKNAQRVFSDEIFNSSNYRQLISNASLSEDDFIYRALSKQNIEWQRMASPKFTRDDENPNKWRCEVRGLTRNTKEPEPIPSEYFETPEIPSTVTPPKIIDSPEIETALPNIAVPKAQIIRKTARIPSITTDSLAIEKLPEMEVSKKPEMPKPKIQKTEDKARRYHFGLGVNVSTIIPKNRDTEQLSKALNLPSGWTLDRPAKSIRFGIEIPSKRNFKIGIAYQNTTFELRNDNNSLYSSTGYSKHGYDRGKYDYYYDSENYNEISLHGVDLSIGTFKNAINPTIGINYASGTYAVSNDFSAPTNNTIKMVGTHFGLDFGRRWFKLGINGGLNWITTNTENQSTVFPDDINFEDYTYSLGAGVKIFF